MLHDLIGAVHDMKKESASVSVTCEFVTGYVSAAAEVMRRLMCQDMRPDTKKLSRELIGLSSTCASILLCGKTYIDDHHDQF